MTLFEWMGWAVIVAAFASVGWLLDGERGAGLASLAAPVLIAALILRERAGASSKVPASDWEPQAQWTLTRGQALAEAWSRGMVRSVAGLLVVFALPGSLALITRPPSLPLPWRWGALVIATAVAPFVVVIAATLARAFAALRNRERSARWSNSELCVRIPGGDWSAPRQLLRRRAWRDVMIIERDGESEDVVAMPIDIAVRAGLGRETEPHGPSFD